MNGEPQIIAQSPQFKKILELARKAAASSANVLISGESGTGKEVVARYIHDLSPRSKQIFLPINCSAIPDQLLESELFGYARGSFTGAMGPHAGLFEEANGGTVFLDEIGDLDLHLQAKLLRVLQERKVKRVGENYYRSLNIRILAATHNDLNRDVLEKKFREDLYFRLNVVPIDIPPLRERPEDILPLAHHFLRTFSLRYFLREKRFSPQVGDYLVSRSWWGNVRELENLIERAVVLSSSEEITEQDLVDPRPLAIKPYKNLFETLCQKEGRLLSLEELCQQYIEFALQVNHGARDKTARDLGIDRKTLHRRLNMTRQ